eukprot:scaffold1613_cov592-Pavlova_lutheri.AAC.1
MHSHITSQRDCVAGTGARYRCMRALQLEGTDPNCRGVRTMCAASVEACDAGVPLVPATANGTGYRSCGWHPKLYSTRRTVCDTQAHYLYE